MEIPKRRRWIVVAGVITALLAVIMAGAWFWYQWALSPVDSNDAQDVSVEVGNGHGASIVGSNLKEKGLIRNEFAFSTYVRLHGLGGKFKKCTYTVRKNQSVPEIIHTMTHGAPGERTVTIYPEATLRGRGERTVLASLRKAGFDEADIEKAFNATYTSPVLDGRPEGVDLEGYIYPDTYAVSGCSNAQQAIARGLDEFATVVEKYQLKQKFAAQGLTLHQGITLASIVQKESKGCGGAATCEDQRQIARVFYNRLKAGMNLGSDVTYHYAADKANIPRDHRLDSPYNTRLHGGLPPGPIATPGLSALLAVADPADNDALYFLSGDDDVTYFARTNEQHEANIRAHCHKKCQLP